MNFNSNQAIYLQIADNICENIILKKWNNEDRIPSVREMAVIVEVNPNTIMRTFTFLQEKEIISNRRGIGYFVAEDGLKNAISYKKERFINEDLEYFFNSLYLLKINFDDLKSIYEDYKTKFSGAKNENN